MRHKPALEVMQRAIRAQICTQCSQRPKGSEALPPTVSRSCEPECSIFVHLPEVKRIAEKLHESSMAPYERAVQELVCQTCNVSPTAGDFCDGRTSRNCPLSRYLNRVVETLEAVAAVVP